MKLFFACLLCLAALSASAVTQSNALSLHKNDEDDYLSTVELGDTKETLKVPTLNRYIQILVGEDCEILYASKEQSLLVLVICDSKGRLIANAREAKGAALAWTAMEGENFERMIEHSGFSSIIVNSTKKIADEQKPSHVTTKFQEGFVFLPSEKNEKQAIRLNLFLSDKKHKSIDVFWGKPDKTKGKTKGQNKGGKTKGTQLID